MERQVRNIARAVGRRLCLAAALVSLASVTFAQERAQEKALEPAKAPWKPALRADGQPDLSGTWRAVPSGTYDITAVISGGAVFDRLLDQKEGRELKPLPSRVVDPPDGRIPYLPWAREKQQEVQANADAPRLPRHIDPRARCLPGGVPRETFPTGFQFRQYPGVVVFLGAQKHVARVIYLDGRPPLGDDIKLWMGSSRGHWEGNTLVVDVRNQNSKGRFDMAGNFASDKVRVTERWTIVDADTLQYRATLEDPSVYSRPWTIESRVVRDKPDNEPYGDELWEDACHEGERSVEHMLLTEPGTPTP
jgi:hypothetical protein